MDYNYILNIAKATAFSAGRLIQREREFKGLSIDFKKNIELVTSADISADKLISSEIIQNFPGHVILSEESSPDLLIQNDCPEFLWIIDPIDGTVNYAHYQRKVAVSIAFAVNGVVKLGVIHAPFLNETYTAIKGQGAFLNEKLIACSQNSNLKSAIIGTGFPYDKSDIEYLIRRLRAVFKNFQDIRRTGSAALDLCSVACGRLEGYYETIKPWDLAAGCLIAKEAGCNVGHLYSSKSKIPSDLLGDELVVASPGIYTDLVEILRNADSENT